MSRLYKIVFVVIIFFLAIINFSFFLFKQEIASYLKIDVEIEDSAIVRIRAEAEGVDDYFDLAIIDRKKFVSLKDFSVDLSGFVLPDDLEVDDQDVFIGDDGDNIDTDIIELPIFEVGNKNPFEVINR